MIYNTKISENVIMNCDSYKVSHFMYLEEGTTYSTSYIEARKGAEFDETVFFGLQYILETGFTKPVTKEMVDQAEEVLTTHGEPFNRKGWDYIVDRHNGYLPIRIKAVKEGSVVPVNNALVVVESTDPHINAVWAASFIETKLMRLWYPVTIATLSREFKKIIHNALERTGDPSQASMKLVDFGSRGVSGFEQSMLGGAAHLINFNVTDNLPGMAMVMDYYGDGKTVPAFSIPATEHSVTTSWGKNQEYSFYENIIDNVLPKTGISSVVVDTYNTFNAIEMLGKMSDKIEKNGTIVVRPDSGDPVEMTERVVLQLDKLFGSNINEKGFKILNDCVRIIQGDGIDLETTKNILDNFEKLGYSADNITFGSGGALLQKVNRDTMRFAMKASNVTVDGESRDIKKSTETDPTKASKAGKLDLVYNSETKQYRTVNQHDNVDDNEKTVLENVFENGKILRRQTFDEIKEICRNS